MLYAEDYSVDVCNSYHITVYSDCIFCDNTADFNKSKYDNKLIAGKNFKPSDHGDGHQAPQSMFICMHTSKSIQAESECLNIEFEVFM